MKRQKFTVEVIPTDALGQAEEVIADAGGAEVIVSGPNGRELEFVTLMCVAEYFMYLAAKASDLDYDEAIEALVRGATEWREGKV